MTLIRTLSTCLPPIDSRSIGEIEQEIVDELDFHLAMRTDEHIAQGVSPEAARAAALTQFGDVARIRQKCRRALLGERIMWQRIQFALVIVLLAAVALLAVQLYNSQRANQAALADITTALKQLETPPAKNETNETPAAATEPGRAYPIKLSADQVREFASLAVDFGKLKLRGEAITVVPISTDVGVTGAVVIGNGTYTYMPEKGKEFTGQFRAATLRFNPNDADAIIKLSAGKAVTDKGALELAQSVVARTIHHCWQSSGDALIPPPRTIAAVVFSRELGDVLFSGDDTMAVVYNFTDNKSLYEKN